MRRLVDHWWLVGSALLVAVVALAAMLAVGEFSRHDQQRRTAQRQALSVLSESVDDVLGREATLARVAGTLRGPLQPRWPVLSNIVMSQPLADSAAFIQPITQRDRATFERQTGLRLVESPAPGVIRVAARRPLHLVLTAYRRAGGGQAPLGLDLAANALRRSLLQQVQRTGRQLASPPVAFLTRTRPTRGVVVYAAVRDARGHLTGWVSAAYETQQLASMVTTHMPGVRLTIHDGASTLIAGPHAGPPAIMDVAGRRWSVWTTIPAAGISAVPLLVLGFGLALVAAVMLILRQAEAAARRSARELEQRDAEEAALGRITTLVAQGESPNVVFASVAEQVAVMLNSCTAAVSRFDAAANRGTIVGGWSDEGVDLAPVPYALDGVTASAEVSRTGRSARTPAMPGNGDPISAIMSRLAARTVLRPRSRSPANCGAPGRRLPGERDPGRRRGAPGALRVPGRTGHLQRRRLGQARGQASTDPLTGIANRRTFHERLTAEVARAERYGRHLSLALMDLDHFKAVNDLHGHPGGDRVLVLLAQILSTHSREGELVARIGGEEFAWLMPETDQDGAHIAAERVREAIASTRFENIGQVTLSAGICSTEIASDADTLMHDADRALYWAKDSGRNMTLRYTEEIPDRVRTAPSAAAGTTG